MLDMQRLAMPFDLNKVCLDTCLSCMSQRLKAVLGWSQGLGFMTVLGVVSASTHRPSWLLCILVVASRSCQDVRMLGLSPA